MNRETIEVLWGETVQFDKPEKRLFMVYYGLIVYGFFIGFGFLVSKFEQEVRPIKAWLKPFTYRNCEYESF